MDNDPTTSMSGRWNVKMVSRYHFNYQIFKNNAKVPEEHPSTFFYDIFHIVHEYESTRNNHSYRW